MTECIIDLEMGSLFTHGLFTYGERTESLNVATTHHDLTHCLLDCLQQGAKRLGFGLNYMLQRTETIRLSIPFATNAVLQGKGPKLGIIVTKGDEHNLNRALPHKKAISKYQQAFMLPHIISGVEEEIDEGGNERVAINDQEVIDIAESLIDSGVQTIVVGLKNSHANPGHEQKVRRLIESEYPVHYLGAVPLLLASDFTQDAGDHQRINTAIISAYVRNEMDRHLHRIEETLRQLGYAKPVRVVHSAGGVTRVGKTTPVETYNSGPAAALIGCHWLAKNLYNVHSYVMADVGGMNVRAGIVKNDGIIFDREPIIFGLSINKPLLQMITLNGGGNSVAHIDGEGIKVGPQKAELLASPITNHSDSLQPRVTDADLVSGRLNAEYFLGGINTQKAREAIGEHIAAPLGISIEEAAYRIIQATERDVADQLAKELGNRDLNRDDLVLLAVGGGGGCRCCGYAERLGLSRIIIPVFSEAAGAFGASRMNVVHSYERWLNMPLRVSHRKYTNNQRTFAEAVHQMQESAIRDMRGEGFPPEAIDYRLEVKLDGLAGPRFVEWTSLYLNKDDDVERLCNQYDSDSEVVVKLIRLIAFCHLVQPQLPTHKEQGTDSTGALKGERDVYWGKWVPTKIYDRRLLTSGNEVRGPAIIEAPNTTCVISPGWKYRVDKHQNGLVEVDKLP